MRAASGDGWLRKPLRGGGGRGIRRWTGGRLRPTEILQRRVDGLSCSAVAVANGRDAVLLGITEQLHRGYAWVGNRLLADAEIVDALRAACEAVVARFGVRGAFGVDAIWDGRELWVLEVNPRPTASLELFGPGAFALHLRGARGHALNGPIPAPCDKVKLVLFADHDIRAPALDWWPAGLVRDIPHPGELIRRGRPVCTLVGAEDDVAEGARWLPEMARA